MRVLVVDDHAIVRQGIMCLLQAEPDVTVVGEAANGERAVEMAKALEPDVVLMDISMPVMNGIEATRTITAQCPRVQVIGLSMFTAAEQAKLILDAGAVAYASKTDSPDDLLATIRACVHSDPSRQPDLFASKP